MGRLLTKLRIKTKSQARHLADDLADMGCRMVKIQRTRDRASPYHIYGSCRKRKAALTFKRRGWR